MQQWSRRNLKSQAKAILKQHYWTILLAYLILSLLNIGFFIGMSSIADGLSSILRPSRGASATVILNALFAFWGIMVAYLVISSIIALFVSNVISVGICRYSLDALKGEADRNALLWAFRGGRYKKVVATMFIYDLRIVLWTLLFIIPGIVKTYQYFYIPYILAENPDIGTRRAFQLTKGMTDGDKANIWVMGLSFIGWGLPGYFIASLLQRLLGSSPLRPFASIAVIIVLPYMALTYAGLYTFAKKRAIDQGIVQSAELKGF